MIGLLYPITAGIEYCYVQDLWSRNKKALFPHQDETLCPGYQDSISRTEVVHSSKVSTGQFHYLMFHLGPQSAVNIIRDWIHLF